jgi:LuxR family transcriptional regulator, maltose regulon positive regulatory protein
MMYTGRVNILKQWIQALPEDCLQNHLRLKLFETWIDLLQGICDLSKQKIQETEQLIQSLPPSPDNNQLKVELMVILCRFIAISGDSPQAIQLANEALRALPESDLASRARVQSALSIAYGLSGESGKAEVAFQESFRLARASAYYSLMAHTTMMIAIGNARFGKLREPARYLQEVIDLGTQSKQRIFYPAGQADIGLSSIHLEWNDLGTAEQLLEQGIALCSQSGLDGVFSGLILKARLRQAKGDLKGALEEIRAAERTFQRKDHDTANRQVQALLAMGDVESAAQFILPMMSILNANPTTQRIPALLLEGLKITLARILLARGEMKQARTLLDTVQAEAEQGKRFGHLIEVYMLQSIAMQNQNGGITSPAALQSFERALALAEPEGFTLLFLEMGGSILPLLQTVMQDSTAAQPAKRQASLLLEALAEKDHPLPTPVLPDEARAGKCAPQAFDLSQRELEILRLIGAGYSNQEIADRLVITLHTVKKHSSHIFAKLGVTSRTQAVARARQAGLL